MRKKRVTHTKLMKAIKNSNGIITIIADRLGVCRQTVHKYMNEDAEAKALYESECETVLDIAEVVVIDAIKNQDIQTAKWYLGTKGGKRGYNPAIELKGNSSEPITLNFYDKEGENFGGQSESSGSDRA